MELKLYFSEEEMREFLEKHGYVGIEVKTYEEYEPSGMAIECKVEIFWNGSVKPDEYHLNKTYRHKSVFIEYMLENTFKRVMKTQLLKL